MNGAAMTKPLTVVSVFLCAIGSAFCPGIVRADDFLTTLEITGSSQSPSYKNGGAWGWWDPSKYQTWDTVDESSFELAEIRLRLPGEEYSGFLSVELYPQLTGEGLQYDEDGSVIALHSLEFEIKVYDLALTQNVVFPSGDLLRPWIALTNMQIKERRIPLQEPGLPVDRAESKLWGAAVGLDAEFGLTGNFIFSGRLVARWATGDRKATFTPESSNDDPGSTEVKATDSVDKLMWGGELGIRWKTHRRLGLEGGWRYRDWTDDDGPASFDGLYIRLLLHL